MFSGKKYKLPQYPPNAQSAFNRLCRAVSLEEIEQLRAILAERMTEMRENALSNNKINLGLAEKINERCNLLLQDYPDKSRHQQALIVGAVSYFVAENDSFSDEAFATGFNDDAQVVNHVLEEIGIEDQFIEF